MDGPKTAGDPVVRRPGHGTFTSADSSLKLLDTYPKIGVISGGVFTRAMLQECGAMLLGGALPGDAMRGLALSRAWLDDSLP